MIEDGKRFEKAGGDSVCYGAVLGNAVRGRCNSNL